MSDRICKCPNCKAPAEEVNDISGGYGVGEYHWYGDCDECGASWEYWTRGYNGKEKREFILEFEDDEDEDS